MGDSIEFSFVFGPDEVIGGFVPGNEDIGILIGHGDIVTDTPVVFLYDYPFDEPFIRMYNGQPMSRQEAATFVDDEFVEILGDDASDYVIMRLEEITMEDIFNLTGGYARRLQREIGYNREVPIYLVVVEDFEDVV